MTLEWSADRLHFVWMTQRLPEFRRTFEDVGRVAKALGVAEEDIRETRLPIEEVSCGVPFVFVPMRSRAAVDTAIPDPRLLDFEAYIFTTDRSAAHDSATTYSRMFAPTLGVYEDPATGSASGPLGSYLVRLQGVKLGRPSWIHVSVDTAAGAISRVRVGGTSVFVAEGTMEVEE